MTSVPPSPFRRSSFLHLHTSEPCRPPGPITPTLHGFRTRCTIGRSPSLLDFSSAQYSEVRSMCQFVRTHFISIHRSRNCNRSVHSMYDRVAQSDKSRKGRHQMGTNGLHRCPDVCCDNVFCDGPLDFPCSLHQQSRVSWWRSSVSWTCRIHVASKMDYYGDYFRCWVSGEPVDSRWSLGKSHISKTTQASNRVPSRTSLSKLRN